MSLWWPRTIGERREDEGGGSNEALFVCYVRAREGGRRREVLTRLTRLFDPPSSCKHEKCQGDAKDSESEEEEGEAGNREAKMPGQVT